MRGLTQSGEGEGDGLKTLFLSDSKFSNQKSVGAEATPAPPLCRPWITVWGEKPLSWQGFWYYALVRFRTIDLLPHLIASSVKKLHDCTMWGKRISFVKMYSNSNIILTYLIIFWKKYSSIILKSSSSNMIFTWCKYCSAVGRCILKALWRFLLLFYKSTIERDRSIFMTPVTFYDRGDLETN